MTKQEVIDSIRCIKDFPIKGIIFRDITTAFKNPECIEWFSNELENLYKDKGITKVVGIESRGFLMGPVLCNRLNAGFVMARKPNKLPAETLSYSYEKEYGTDTIEIHKDALNENDIVLIHDDLLATGGSMKAAIELVKQFGVKKIYVNFLTEITECADRRDAFDKDIEVTSLLVLND